jgi:ClpP class serine protease
VPHFCRGRVWLGSEAATIGLVDQLGNVDVAVAQVEKLTSRSLARLHISGHNRPSWVAKQAQKVVRDAVPIGIRSIGGPVLDTLGPASTAWLSCSGQPLALWPYDLVIR